MQDILNKIAPFQKNKKRSILLMGCIYDEVIKEIKEAIINVMEESTPKTKTKDEPHEDTTMDIEDAIEVEDITMIIRGAIITIDTSGDPFSIIKGGPSIE